MVFKATFYNILVISWRSVLLVQETGENHRPVASHWQTLSHNVVQLALTEIKLRTSVVTGTDCIGSCKSNYHTITTTTAPWTRCRKSLKMHCTKGVIRSHKLKRERQCNSQQKEEEQTTIYRKLKIERHEPHLKPGVNSGAPESKQFLLHIWYSLCYSLNKHGDKLWMRKGRHCDYDKLNIFVVACDTDIL